MPKKKKRLLKWSLGLLLVLVVLLVVGVWFAPAIASPFAPRLISDALNKQIAGSVEVSEVELSWFGSQHVSEFTLNDPEGNPIGTLNAHADVTLFDLATGVRDLGTIRLSGDLDVVRDADGVTNLQRATAFKTPPTTPAPSAPSSATGIPPGLAVDVRIDSLSINYRDAGFAGNTDGKLHGLALRNIRGSGSLGVGAPAELSLRAETAQITEPDGEPQPDSGWFAIEVKADSLLGATGLVDPGTITGSISVSAQSPLIELTAEAALADGNATLGKPLALTLHAETLADLVPLVRDVFENDVVTPDALPDIILTINSFGAPVFAPVDDLLQGLRGAGTLTIDEFTGTVALESGTRRMRVEPIELTFNADTPGGDVTLAGTGGARFAQSSAGTLKADLTLGSLFANGLPDAGTLLAGAHGRIALTDLETAIAEPLANSLGIDLTDTVGPKLDLQLTGARDADNTTFVVDVQSDNITAAGGGYVSPEGASLDEGGLTVFIRNAGPLARQSMAHAGVDAVTLVGDSSLHIGVSELNLPFADGQPALHKLRTHAIIGLDGFDIEGFEQLESLSASNITLTLEQQDGKSANLELTGDATVNASPFDIEGKWALANLRKQLSLAPPDRDFAAVRPVGRLTVTGDAGALSGSFIDDPELVSLITDAVGDTTTLELRTSELEGALGSAHLTATNALLRAEFRTDLREDQLAVTTADVRGRISPELFERLVDNIDQLDTKLAETMNLRLSADPITLPLRAWSIDTERAATETIRATLGAGASLASLAIGDDDFGPVAVPELAAVLTAPVAVLLGDTAPITINATTGIRAGETALVGATISAGTDYTLGVTPDQAEVSIELDDIDVDWVQNRIGADAPIVELLGDSADIKIRSKGALLDRSKPTLVTIDIDSSGLRTKAPIDVHASAQRFGLAKPAELELTLSPTLASELLFGTSDEKASLATITAPLTLTASFNELVVPTRLNPKAGDVLLVDAEFAVPSVPVRFDDGTDVQIRNWTLGLARNDAFSDRVEFEVSADVDEDTLDADKQIRFGGHLSGFHDEQGVLNPGGIVLTATAEVRRFPTALIDSRLRWNGFLYDMLGPATSVRFNADALGVGRGNLLFIAGSHRAGVRISGRLTEKTLVLDDETTGRISTISREFGERIAKGIPVFANFYSRPEDRPASMSMTGLTLPLDGDLANFDGQITIDPGVLHFQTDKLFAPIVKMAKQNTEGFVGQNLQPLTVTITNGVVSYPRYTLPLGEFSIGTEGSVDLVNNTLDLIAWIPFGALTDEAAGQFNSGLGNMLGGSIPLIERLTLVPIRVRGPMDKPRIESDAGLFVGNTLDTLRPDKLIINGLDTLFGNNKDKQK